MAMTSTTTAATMYIHRRDFPPATHRGSPFSNSTIALTENPRGVRRKLVVILCTPRNSSGEVSAPPETESESQIEVPKGPPSLISSLNVDKALRGIAITDGDHYGRLGLQKGKGCSADQVTVAYKSKVEELMSQGLDEAELSEKLELLKESHSILSSVEERRLYDWSLSRSENPDRYEWPYEVDITPMSPESPPPSEPEDVGPTRLVGYFMLTWLILGFTLSVALNR